MQMRQHREPQGYGKMEGGESWPGAWGCWLLLHGHRKSRPSRQPRRGEASRQQPSLSSSPSSRIQLSWQALGRLCTSLGLACFQHSPVVFCPPQRQLQLTAHCPLTPPAFLASSPAGLKAPGGLLLQVREQNPCWQNTAKPSSLPTGPAPETSQGDLWGNQVVGWGRGGGGEVAGQGLT